jgi:hypothetical protein
MKCLERHKSDACLESILPYSTLYGSFEINCKKVHINLVILLCIIKFHEVRS